MTDQALHLVANGADRGIGNVAAIHRLRQPAEVLAATEIERVTGQFGHTEGSAYLARWLRSHYGAQMTPVAVGRRVDRCGLDLIEPTPINAEVIAALEELIPLVLLHQS